MRTELTLNKAVAALVGVAMAAGLALTFAAERAHAVTLSELIELFIALDIIPSDKAEEARAVLANQPETPSTPSTPAAGGSCSYNFTMNLKAGSTGAEVMNLQKFLNLDPATVVAASGAGSKGMETSYYGPATAAAVAKFQEKYAAEILTPLGLSKGTGFFGASTRAKANAVCKAGGPATPPPPPATPGDDDDDATDDDDDSLSGGEASLESFDALSDPSDEDLEEGSEEVKVFGFEFDVEDGDAEVNRVDVNFQSQTLSKEDKPWNSIEAVQIWVGDEMVAEQDTDAKADWSSKGSNTYQVRFTGVDEIIKEGETAEMYVSVTVNGNIDDADLDQTWKVWVPAQGLRARDGAGIDQYTGSDSESETFNIEKAGGDTEMKLTTASANPKASIIKVDDDKVTKDVTVLAFEVEAEDGEVTLNKLMFKGTTSTTSLGAVVSDIKLELDGDVVGDAEWDDNCDGTIGGTGATQGACVIFDLVSDDEEVVIDADEKISGKLIIDFKKRVATGAGYNNGDTVEFDVTGTERALWDVEDVSGDDADSTGSANGERHTLQSSGLFAEIVSIDETKTAGDNNANDLGEFKIKFDLTAFDDTFYVSATSTEVFGARIEDGSGNNVVAATSGMMAITSTASKENSAYRIDDGDTETFTLTVKYNPTASNFYRVELDSVTFGTTAALPYGESHTAAPDEDFESDNLYLNA